MMIFHLWTSRAIQLLVYKLHHEGIMETSEIPSTVGALAASLSKEYNVYETIDGVKTAWQVVPRWQCIIFRGIAQTSG
jgi:hypothetical protein